MCSPSHQKRGLTCNVTPSHGTTKSRESSDPAITHVPYNSSRMTSPFIASQSGSLSFLDNLLLHAARGTAVKNAGNRDSTEAARRWLKHATIVYDRHWLGVRCPTSGRDEKRWSGKVQTGFRGLKLNCRYANMYVSHVPQTPSTAVSDWRQVSALHDCKKRGSMGRNAGSATKTSLR
ncbi:hypothetical protein BDV96DRAFT_354879 [Lophiotrema nucula]|uniref:Uncharacterized protein n=1 Tax=Lophiotrema nucula TaxID=690887 RepID=A0A6A5YI06_9PLEO|nr:hypothetical protein BDV96DRAFT_354879 [Lophiotrema nucula]